MKPDPFQTRRDYARVPVREALDTSNGSSRRLVVIAEDDGTGNPTCIYKQRFPSGFACHRPGEEDTFTAFCTIATGCFFTGQYVFVEKLTLPGGEPRWQVVSTGGSHWHGTTEEVLSSGGDASIIYYRDDMFDDATCVVPAELFNANMPVIGDCWVMFSDSTPSDGTSPFLVTQRDCPTYVATEE